MLKNGNSKKEPRSFFIYVHVQETKSEDRMTWFPQFMNPLASFQSFQFKKKIWKQLTVVWQEKSKNTHTNNETNDMSKFKKAFPKQI